MAATNFLNSSLNRTAPGSKGEEASLHVGAFVGAVAAVTCAPTKQQAAKLQVAFKNLVVVQFDVEAALRRHLAR